MTFHKSGIEFFFAKSSCQNRCGRYVKSNIKTLSLEITILKSWITFHM